ncbi:MULTISPECIES: flagellar basal body rod protein FlgB [Sinorhizobium]|uniref:Flagellar basal body rod protein FlgB n=1 Tax=Sinorhizobium mexicanum TaxID=375549 RepID=A0A859QGR0_9HYPH|nr:MULTISPECIES: flagellar basal body rod protein FlgB [Sinorhizobium]MBP1885941.1 flagellar basal-body rod protein FlgB [Sinorhizobium mexicanum]MDK1377998.1 flagellar basal body rod protein FlgB [Sinorhizobium sp. 6-70]MDK1480550.1 flagellar basal body rod protein FlgB [Sinorhizobium sp. 6-117]QLL60600.1 flagellar basal body rod protein FlgB [Sinorhizobium mexicanum]
MEPIQLFELASRQAQWLTVRQNVVAGNIANANTPHYRAKDVEPFESVLQNTGIQMAATHRAHFTESPDAAQVTDVSMIDDVQVQQSGNTVAIEQEMMKTGEIKRDYELNAGLVKAFHRMMLMTVRK